MTSNLKDLSNAIYEAEIADLDNAVSEIESIIDMFNKVFKERDVCKLLVIVKSKDQRIFRKYVDDIRNKLLDPNVEIEEVWAETPIDERERIFKLVKEFSTSCIVFSYSIIQECTGFNAGVAAARSGTSTWNF